MNVFELEAVNGIEISTTTGRAAWGKFSELFPAATVKTVTPCSNGSVRITLLSQDKTRVAFVHEDVINDLVAQGAVTKNGNADFSQLANYVVLEPRNGQYDIRLPKGEAAVIDMAVAATSKIVATLSTGNSLASW